MRAAFIFLLAVVVFAADPADRAKEMLAKMTVEEKITMVHGKTGAYAGNVPAITRLGIPCLHLEDGPQGVADGVRNATCWPSALTVVASWDTALMYKFAAGMAVEQRTKGTNVLLGPMVNIARVAMNGRNFESFGEDPHLASVMAVANVKGIQDQGVIACVKHIANNNQEVDRNEVSVTVDERTQHEIYYPAFQAAVDAGVGSVMCAYNKINGTYACENSPILTRDLKNGMGFKGWVMSDWFATHSDGPAALAGLDQEMPGSGYFGERLSKLIKNGQFPMSRLDDMVLRILTPMYAMGLFDRPQTGDLTVDATSPAHTLLARDLAIAGTVLLKNDRDLLPLDPATTRKIALIGKDVEMAPVYAGDGSGHVMTDKLVNPYQGIKNRIPSATVLPSSGLWLWEAKKLAQSAQVAIVFVGMPSAEGKDHSLVLPEGQDEIVEAILSVQPNTIVVAHIPGPVLMPWAARVPAIVSAFYPGQEDGNAIAAILFGDVNPSGRLPVTFPPNATAIPVSTPQQYPGVGKKQTYSEKLLVGYRWYDALGVEPLFPFGHGLSYTDFAYNNFVIGTTVSGDMQFSIDISNVGTVAGTETPQLYVGYPPEAHEPPKSLRSFRKVTLEPGERETVTFDILKPAPDLAIWDEQTHGWMPVKGTFTAYVGASSRDIRIKKTFAM